MGLFDCLIPPEYVEYQSLKTNLRLPDKKPDWVLLSDEQYEEDLQAQRAALAESKQQQEFERWKEAKQKEQARQKWGEFLRSRNHT